ncbi:cbb3-type cytochrome c oxidase subunit 3 [Flavobacterium agricola]|uniref:cbb3-type cytochrome c oxidase subunit 3 n=1 Tax=Flavobacterium agricola TaxID=2870839 RepID=UPI002221833C|nr:cbb3-type cytochrome c oxidase subunit 3 [Flavobacterium agricola]
MLKFIKHNMETILGIEIYPIISLIIFFTFFVGLGIWVFTYKKDKIKELSNIPLEDDCVIKSEKK